MKAGKNLKDRSSKKYRKNVKKQHRKQTQKKKIGAFAKDLKALL